MNIVDNYFCYGPTPKFSSNDKKRITQIATLLPKQYQRDTENKQ